jgi:tRNA threonylcarbamoyladenosine biosynthesis protein TsaB
MLVALDTSTSQASIAFVRHDLARDDPVSDDHSRAGPRPNTHVLAELTWEIGRRHSQELVPRLQWLLAACGASPADLTAIAVALGPGSFNGIRVGVATAKALAFALGLPVYGASTLDVIAWGYHEAAVLAEMAAPAGPRVTIGAVLDAGRGEVYAAHYVASAPEPPTDRAATDRAATDRAVCVGPGLWRTSEPRVVSPADLAATSPGPVLLSGEWRPATGADLAAAFGPRALFAPALGGRRASWLAALALDRRARGEADEPATIEPRYLRRPAITRSARHPVAAADDLGSVALQVTLGEEGDKGETRALRH